MRIISFNVNGLRARIKSGFPTARFLETYKPDVICLQEVRAKPEQIPANFLAGYNRYHSLHEKAGYAGAWTFVHKDVEQPLLSIDDFPMPFEKGRVNILDFKYFKLINSYSPNAGSRLEKLAHRKEFEAHLADYIEKASEFKPVILCGDLNVAPTAKDTNITCQAGCSIPERSAYKALIDGGLVDIWRFHHPNEQKFSFFSNMYDARGNDKGMRLDHFLIDKALVKDVTNIQYIYEPSAHCGSDHTPMLMEIDL